VSYYLYVLSVYFGLFRFHSCIYLTDRVVDIRYAAAAGETLL